MPTSSMASQVLSDQEASHESIELSHNALNEPMNAISRRINAPSQSIESPSEIIIDNSASQLPSTSSIENAQEKWNSPTSNIGRLGFCFFSFVITGMNDGVVGALVPYLEDYYNINHIVVSLIFLTPFAGYSVAAFANASIHAKFGQRGIAVAAPLCHIFTYAIICVHPPYPVIVVINVICGLGNGLTDACFCAWAGSMESSNAIQGILQACYSLGALLAPLIATSMITKAQLPWYVFYYIMVSASIVEWAGLTLVFWDKTSTVSHSEHGRESRQPQQASRTREALKTNFIWVYIAFLFVHIGIEIGLGGWVVTFMLKVRNASPYDAGISSTGFWAGMAVGRLCLGFVTERFGERLSVCCYLALSIALELVFWLVPSFRVSAVAVAVLGFFLGPIFPASITMATKLFPKHLQVSALGFSMAIGGAGGTVFPFAIGAIAASQGVNVLQPIILSLIVVLGIIWLCLPRPRRQD